MNLIVRTVCKLEFVPNIDVKRKVNKFELDDVISVIKGQSLDI